VRPWRAIAAPPTPTIAQIVACQLPEAAINWGTQLIARRLAANQIRVFHG